MEALGAKDVDIFRDCVVVGGVSDKHSSPELDALIDSGRSTKIVVGGGASLTEGGFVTKKNRINGYRTSPSFP